MTRIKGHITFPSKSIEYILNKRNLKPEDIDFVAVGCENILSLDTQYFKSKNNSVTKSYFFYFIGKLINLIKTYFWSFDDKNLSKNIFII